jgi:hypothetical protein
MYEVMVWVYGKKLSDGLAEAQTPLLQNNIILHLRDPPFLPKLKSYSKNMTNLEPNEPAYGGK